MIVVTTPCALARVHSCNVSGLSSSIPMGVVFLNLIFTKFMKSIVLFVRSFALWPGNAAI